MDRAQEFDTFDTFTLIFQPSLDLRTKGPAVDGCLLAQKITVSICHVVSPAQVKWNASVPPDLYLWGVRP